MKYTVIRDLYHLKYILVPAKGHTTDPDMMVSKEEGLRMLADLNHPKPYVMPKTAAVTYKYCVTLIEDGRSEICLQGTINVLRTDGHSLFKAVLKQMQHGESYAQDRATFQQAYWVERKGDWVFIYSNDESLQFILTRL